MAVESSVMFRRIARIACLVLLLGLLPGGAAVAQLPITAPAPVTEGSIIPFHHGASGQWGQIYSLKRAFDGQPGAGNILFLDSSASQLFQLAPGAAKPTLIALPASANSDCSDLEASGTYWNSSIAFDKWNNLYITDRYGSAVQFCRVPYNASAGTWTFSNADIWNKVIYTDSNNQQHSIPPQDLTVADDGVTFYVSTSSNASIYKFTVDQSGNVSNVTPIVTGAETMIMKVAVDHAGNLYFVENIYPTPVGQRVTGIREIPASFIANIVSGSQSPITGAGDGSAEANGTLRVDPSGAGWTGISGVTFDAWGNLYFTSVNNSNYGGNSAGAFMIPNEGTPAAPKLVWADTVRVSIINAGQGVLVDPRGFLWFPDGSGSNFTPPGTAAAAGSATYPTCDTTSAKTIDATCTTESVVLWRQGALSAGSSAVGTASTPQVLYYMFSQPTTFSQIALTQPSGKSFALTANPNADPNTTPAVAPCIANNPYPAFSANETTNTAYSWCAAYVTLNPNTAGAAESELQLLDSSNGVISGSNAYVNGIGQGSAAAALASPTNVPLASGLSAPMQVASDPWGNTYVADSSLKEVVKFAAGSTSTAAGTSVGTGFTSPTGVAVDGAGNLYIGDSGKVYEIPWVNGALDATQQTVIGTGFGAHLNLAADGYGEVFVADKDNKQVVEIPNPQTTLLLQGTSALKLGASANFTGPTAIATDNSGNAWVADGTNLWEITMPFGGATEITSSLQGTVTGLAIDPSGSVLATSASGLVWIPYQTSSSSAGLNVNGTVVMATGFGTGNAALPVSVALDGSDNVYVDYGSSATAGLSQLGIGGTLNFDDFGEVNPNVPFEVDAQMFNVGNTPLTLAAYASDTITGTDATSFSVGTATLNSPSCDPAGSTNPGGSCYLGLTIQAPQPTSPAQAVASVSVASNAANAAGGVNIAMSATVIQDLRPGSQVTISSPVPDSTTAGCSGSTYPGCLKITITVAAQNSTFGTPAGTVDLAVPGSGSTQAKQTATLDGNGQATFSFTNLLGGTYNVNAVYTGNGTAGTTQNTCDSSTPGCFAGSAAKTTFTIKTATPAFAAGPPGNQGCLAWGTASGDPCVPDATKVTSAAGNTYVLVSSPTWITVSVTSKVGTPTGTVSFCSAYVNNKCTPADPTQPQNPLDSTGKAYFSITNLNLGMENIVAVYNGDINYSSQTLPLTAFQVIQPSVLIGPSSSTLSLKAGTPGQVTLTLTPLVGFSNDVSLSCVAASMPQYSQCTFAYADTITGTSPVGKSGTGATSIVVTISTNVPVNLSSLSIGREAPWALAGLFGLGLLGLAAGRKRMNRYLSMVCLALMFSGLFAAISACTNSGYSTPPPAPKVATPQGTYNVQINTINSTTQSADSLPFILTTTVQ